uniref:MARVEL domain-containing protein n=1 Tax=Plectus sambesii TaxID=2011161 RepID=A0A914UTW6_9BILA
MVAVDSRFPAKRPFGTLMTAQWMLSFAVVIALWNLDFWRGGTALVYYTAWTTFDMGLFSWCAHLVGLHKPLQLGQIHFYIPFAAINFVYSVILFVLYAISTLLCIYFTFTGFRYIGNTAFVYAFATLFCILAGWTCGYLALLLYQASENKPIKLLGIYIEGITTVKFASTAETTTETPMLPK